MPTPLKPGELIYVDHKIKPADYAMPSMQAAYDHYSMGYLVSGDRKWFSYETVQIGHSGNAGISKPNIFHRNLPMSDLPYDRYLIKFKIEVLKPVIDLIGEDNFDKICMHYLDFSLESSKNIEQQFEDMYQEYTKNTPYSQFILQGMLQRLVLTVYQEYLPFDNTVLEFKTTDSRIHESLIYIEKNLEYSPTLYEAAAHASLSPSHFSRLFKEVTGCSYTDYVTSIRLQHACILLGKTDLSISEIALKVGFSNGNYLATVFKNKYNCSPKDFRKNISTCGTAKYAALANGDIYL